MPEISSAESRTSSSSLSNIPRLVISTEITGYTCQFIYGDTYDIDYESIVVPTYKMTLEKDGSVLKTYNVTRDSWYSRGITDSWLWLDKIELTNRCFEPKDSNVNLFSTVPLAYPTSGLDAFALRQRGDENLNAVCHTKKMNTYVNGTSIDDARKDLCKASGVMIHIGGYYYNVNSKKNKLAGSYGCFGFIPEHQKGSESDMGKWRKNKGYEEVKISNEEHKKFIDEVIKVRGTGSLHVLIKKRNEVTQLKTLNNQ